MAQSRRDLTAASVGRLTRRVAAFALLLWGFVGSLANSFAICTSVTTPKGVTETCRPPDLTDAGVLAFVALVLALLWPDITEFSVFGVSVTRQVAQATAKAEGAEHRAAEVERQLAQVRVEVAQQSVAAAQASVTNNFAPVPTAVLENAVQQLDVQLAESPRVQSAERASDRQQHRQLLIGQVMTAWQELIELLVIPLGRRTTIDEQSLPTDYPQRRQFAEEYATDLQLLRQIRNEAAHSALISTRNLELGATLGSNLLRAAHQVLTDNSDD